MRGHRARTRRRRTAAPTTVALVFALVLAATFLALTHHPGRTGHRSDPVHLGAGSSARAAAAPDSSRTSPDGSTSRTTGSERRSAPFDKAAHSTTDPTSIWVVVNKTHPVPADFAPQLSIVRGYQVADVAAGPLAALLDASDQAGLGFKIASAYRSYDYQVHVHDALVASQGSAAADKVSARAGYSEHQTGLAADLITPDSPGCDFDQCFAGTPGGRWLRENAWHYGFVLRYTAANRSRTGYSPEPWHLRYVGQPLAAELRASGTGSLEEYFGISGGDYP